MTHEDPIQWRDALEEDRQGVVRRLEGKIREERVPRESAYLQQGVRKDLT